MIIMTFNKQKTMIPAWLPTLCAGFPTLQGINTQAATWRSPFTSKQSDSESF